MEYLLSDEFGMTRVWRVEDGKQMATMELRYDPYGVLKNRDARGTAILFRSPPFVFRLPVTLESDIPAKKCQGKQCSC